MKVAILGCGPSGLIAAHAAFMAGADITIYSKKRKSEMFGAQYLHNPIPDIEDVPSHMIRYQLQGEVSRYRRKVYGDDFKGGVSPEDYEGDHLAYDIRATYDMLWDNYSDAIEDVNITPAWLAALMPSHFDLTFSSIPAPFICLRDHLFEHQAVWAYGDAPERGQKVDVHCPENTVLCNGLDDPSWYRASNIFGYKTIEWPWRSKPSGVAVSKVFKPIRNNCHCWPNIHRIGRYGVYRKGILVHHAYEAAVDAMWAHSGTGVK